MKNYKNYEKQFIGSSDIASLTLRAPRKAMLLDFGQDARYSAYVVDEECEIPEHYTLVAEAENWMKVYDDDQLTAEFRANRIEVYRAGEMGCLIRLIGEVK